LKKTTYDGQEKKCNPTGLQEGISAVFFLTPEFIFELSNYFLFIRVNLFQFVGVHILSMDLNGDGLDFK